MKICVKYFVIILFGTLILFSCTSETRKKAQFRLDQAKSLYDEKKYEQSLLVIDSIQSWYPEEYAILAEAMELQKTVASEYHGNFIDQASDLLIKAEAQIEELSKNFYYTEGNVNRPGSYEHKRQTVRNSWDRSFLKVNVLEDGSFWLSHTMARIG